MATENHTSYVGPLTGSDFEEIQPPAPSRWDAPDADCWGRLAARRQALAELHSCTGNCNQGRACDCRDVVPSLDAVDAQPERSSYGWMVCDAFCAIGLTVAVVAVVASYLWTRWSL